MFDCTGWGTTDAVLAGLAFVAAQAALLAPTPALASMSVGGAVSQAVNDAVNSLVAAGVPVITSAGNSDGDACSQSPASASGAIAVGATTITDARASFSSACAWGRVL